MFVLYWNQTGIGLRTVHPFGHRLLFAILIRQNHVSGGLQNESKDCMGWTTRSQRLTFLGLETLEVRRIKYDLIMCYKILNSDRSLLEL